MFFDGVSRCTPTVDIPLDVVVRVGKYVGAPHAVALMFEVCVDTTAAAHDALTAARATSSVTAEMSAAPREVSNAVASVASSAAATNRISSSAIASKSKSKSKSKSNSAAAPWSDAMSMLSDVYSEVAAPNLDRALKATVCTTSVLRVALALETLGEWEKAAKVYRLASEKQVRLNRGMPGGGGSTPSSVGDSGSGGASRSTTPSTIPRSVAELTSPRSNRAAFDNLPPIDPISAAMAGKALSAAVLHDLGELGAAAVSKPSDSQTKQVSSFMYRYILRESCSQFDSLPLTSLTIFRSRAFASEATAASRSPRTRRATPRIGCAA